MLPKGRSRSPSKTKYKAVSARIRPILGEKGDDIEVDTSTIASGPQFRICPLCEASRLVFSGLYSARCLACCCEPGSDFRKSLRQIVALPDAPETAQRLVPKKGSDEQEGADLEKDQEACQADQELDTGK